MTSQSTIQLNSRSSYANTAPPKISHTAAESIHLQGHPHTKRSSALTAPGFLFVFVTLFLALGAINGQNNLLFWLFGFSIASLVVSGIITGTALINIRLTAHELEEAEAGKPFLPRYTIHNTSKLLPNFALEIIELDAPTPTHFTPGALIHIPPKSSAPAHSQLVPESRGYLNLERVRVRSRFPFGLFKKTIDFNIPRQTVVFPAQIELKPIDLARMASSEDSSNQSINRRGSGLDYFSLRQYRSGDPLRLIAWKQSARTNSLLVIEYPEPVADQINLHLACPDESTSQELFELAVSLAYSLLRKAPHQSRIGLSIPWASIQIPPASGQSHILRAARVLSLVERSSQSESVPGRNQDADPLYTPRSFQQNSQSINIAYSHSDQSSNDLVAQDYASLPTTGAMKS
ncbi:MAG: DUF58 domain-containing protein [Phycisphaerales bacterium]